jgi:hypothetical protein
MTTVDKLFYSLSPQKKIQIHLKSLVPWKKSRPASSVPSKGPTEYMPVFPSQGRGLSSPGVTAHGEAADRVPVPINGHDLADSTNAFLPTVDNLPDLMPNDFGIQAQVPSEHSAPTQEPVKGSDSSQVSNAHAQALVTAEDNSADAPVPDENTLSVSVSAKNSVNALLTAVKSVPGIVHSEGVPVTASIQDCPTTVSKPAACLAAATDNIAASSTGTSMSAAVISSNTGRTNI